MNTRYPRMDRPTTSVVPPPRTLASMAERMLPNASDLLTETLHWQRYVFFRPWYEGRVVLDAGCGEGYGTNYASTFATQAIGMDVDAGIVGYASRKYPKARFVKDDLDRAAFDRADVVLCFETLESLSDPKSFLRRLNDSGASVAISTANRLVVSPGRGPLDRPRNRYRQREFAPEEFRALIEGAFPNRTITFLSQEPAWHGAVNEGLSETAVSLMAVVGDLPVPRWPRIGLAMPTLDNVDGAADVVLATTRTYPGEIEFAIALNGCSDAERKKAEAFRAKIGGRVHLVELPTNEGFAAGCNAGLARLVEIGGFDYYGVTNDDVAPAIDCIAELVAAMQNLQERGLRPGAIGPVSNIVHGHQQVDIGAVKDYRDMLEKAEAYHREHAMEVTPVRQLRGLFLLLHPACLAAVGGFDPRFGMGNFEDDDHNVRTALAGFSLWMANGAFLYHAGSTTFRKLNVDYGALIQRNAEILCAKWLVPTVDAIWHLKTPPPTTAIYLPLDAKAPTETEVAAEPAARPIQETVLSIEPDREPEPEPPTRPPTGGRPVPALRPAFAHAYYHEFEGRSVDVINQLDDQAFGRWVAQMLDGVPRSARFRLVQAVVELMDADEDDLRQAA